MTVRFVILIPAESLVATEVKFRGHGAMGRRGLSVGVKVVVDGTVVSLLGAVIYDTGFQVPMTTALSDGAHTVQVDVKDTAGNLRQATSGFTTDVTPPVFSNVTPANGAVLTANLVVISLNYSDVTSGIDPSGVRIVVDGVDVTAQATVSETSLQYLTPAPLIDGAHEVTIRVVDVADNFVDVNVSFQVMTDAVPRSAIKRLAAACEYGDCHREFQR